MTRHRNKLQLHRLLLILVAGFTLQGCGTGPKVYSSAEDFLAAYTGEPVTRQQKCDLGICMDVALHSPSYIVAREWSRGLLEDTAEAQERWQNLRGQLRFVVYLTPQEGGTLEPYWKNLDKGHFYLQKGEEQLECAFFYDETVPGLHQGRNVHVIFEPNPRFDREEFQLVLDLPQWGISSLQYNLESIKNLPQFTIKSSTS